MAHKPPEEWDPPLTELAPGPAPRERRPLFDNLAYYQQSLKTPALIAFGMYFLFMLADFYYWMSGNSDQSGIMQAAGTLPIMCFVLYAAVRSWGSIFQKGDLLLYVLAVLVAFALFIIGVAQIIMQVF